MSTSVLPLRRRRRQRPPMGKRRRRAMRARQITGFVLGIIVLLPLLWLIVSALRPAADTFSSQVIPHHWTLSNFSRVFKTVALGRYLLNSFVVATVITLVALWFHSMAGYALARVRFPGRGFLFGAIVGTLLIAQSVILVPLFLLVKDIGWLSTYAGLIVPNIFNAFGIFWLRQYYLGIPSELEQAARIDGCSWFKVWWHVAVPLSRPVLASLAVLFFLVNWNAYLWPLTITLNNDLWTVQVGLSSLQGQHAAAWNLITAGALIAAAPTVLLFVFFQRHVTDALKTSGLR